MTDLKAYFNISKLKFIWICLLIFGITYLCKGVIVQLIDWLLVTPLFSKIPESGLTNCLLVLLLVYSFNRIRYAIIKKLLPTIKSLLFFATILIIYFSFFRPDKKYTFYTFNLWNLSWLNYADIIVTSLVFLFVDLRSYSKKLDVFTKLSLIEDNPNPKKNEDKYGSQGYAAQLVSYINDTTTDSSFTIGIFSEWGSGKTDFMLRLKELLEPKNKQNEDNVIIEFNPWKVSGTDVMIEDFFKTMAKGIKPYNNSVSEKIKDYSRKIFQTAKEVHLKTIDTILNDLFKDESITEKYNSINKSIEQTGKRFIVFIDDLDRLTGDEIIAVLRLVRNTANFANTFFVVALDQTYTINVLKKTKKISNEDQYLKKIFQLVIALPTIRKDIFSRELKQLLNFETMESFDKMKLQKVLDQISYDPSLFNTFGFATHRHESYIESMLQNMRDVKRLANSFKISFKMLKDDIELIDLMLLEIIKVSCFEIYYGISKREVICIDDKFPFQHTINNKFLDSFLESKQKLWSQKYQNDIKAILEALINGSNKSHRKFEKPNNFYLYFSYQLFGLIPLKEFRDTIDKDAFAISEKLKEWNNDKSKDINIILDNYTEYKDANEFKKLILSYLLVNDSNDYFVDRAAKIILDYENLIPRYFSDEAEFILFLNELFINTQINPYGRAIIANKFLYLAAKRNEKKLLNKIEWQEIVYKLFDEFLNIYSPYDPKVFNFYLLNDDSREQNTDRVILNRQAGQRLKEYILSSSENLKEYLRYFIRSYSQPTDGNFVFEPFVLEIFSSKNEFKDALKRLTINDTTLQRLQQIVLSNIDKIDSNDRQFKLNDDDKSFVLDHLRTTGQYNFPK